MLRRLKSVRFSAKVVRFWTSYGAPQVRKRASENSGRIPTVACVCWRISSADHPTPTNLSASTPASHRPASGRTRICIQTADNVAAFRTPFMFILLSLPSATVQHELRKHRCIHSDALENKTLLVPALSKTLHLHLHLPRSNPNLLSCFGQ